MQAPMRERRTTMGSARFPCFRMTASSPQSFASEGVRHVHRTRWNNCGFSAQVQHPPVTISSLRSTVHITSVSSFIMAHNLLLLAVRQRVIGKQEVRSLGGSRDYILEQVYLPVTKLELAPEYKYLVSKVLSHAERVGFIREGNATFLKVVADLRSEIRETKLQLETALVTVAREMNRVEQRVGGLEKWTVQATQEFQKVCDGQRQIVKDMQNMGASLNELHSLLRKHQRQRMISGALGFCLSMIPAVGGIFAGGHACTWRCAILRNPQLQYLPVWTTPTCARAQDPALLVRNDSAHRRKQFESFGSGKPDFLRPHIKFFH